MSQITNSNNSNIKNIVVQPITNLKTILIQNNNNNNSSINISNDLQNLNINNISNNNAKNLIKQPLKKTTGLNFKNFKKYSSSQNISNYPLPFIYFLSRNKNYNLENNKKTQNEIINNDNIPKNIAQNFEQISNVILSQERDFYKEIEEQYGKIRTYNFNNNINVISNTNNIKVIDKIEYENKINPYNYIQENYDFDFNNNKMGMFFLLQQNGKKDKDKIETYSKRCYAHQRRKEIKKRKKVDNINLNKLKSFNKIFNSKINTSNIVLTLDKNKNNLKINNINTFNINSLKQNKSYLTEEENNLFEKYFNSFIPYFKELIINRNLSREDKIIKLREVFDINVINFREGRRSLCEFIKSILTPANMNNPTIELTTKELIGRIIKFFEKDYEQKNYLFLLDSLDENYNEYEKKNKEDFISNYTNNMIYTYFSEVTSNSQSQTIILWGKIFYFIRFGWKRDCIKYISSIEGMYISESGLREIKESLDENKEINIQNYIEFKRILNQERKEENPFKHACMVYMTKILDELYTNVLLEINDHLWFNLNLIYPQDNYDRLIIIENEKYDKDKDNIFEINTNNYLDINNNGNDCIRYLELIKLKDLQKFFENINNEDILNLNNKYTNFAYIILLAGLLKFKDAILFMIKNNMYIDAINFYFILQQIGIYSNFNEINNEVIIPQKRLAGEKISELEEIYYIYPRVSNNIPALILYSVFSDDNFVQPFSYLILETESFWVLYNYHERVQLFNNDMINKMKMNDYLNNNININLSINTIFNVCLQDLMDEDTLKIICKNIFELLLKYQLKNNANLNPLFETFKDLRMLTELTGILIFKSIELLNLKKPIITHKNNEEYSIELIKEENQQYFGQSLILSYFGSLIDDVNIIFLEKQNEKNYLIKNNINNIYNEKIFLLDNEINENNLLISLLKILPIIENIYELINIRKFDEAFKLYMENIYIVQVGFNSQEIDYLSEFRKFMNEIIKKMKYGLIGLYPDILYLFIWLFRYELNYFHRKGYYNYIEDMKYKSKALEFLLDRLCEISNNDRDLMEYSMKFQMCKEEINKIQQFYLQNNYI